MNKESFLVGLFRLVFGLLFGGMMNRESLLVGLFTLVFGLLFGGMMIQESIVKNCDQLGGFSAGSKVFECHRKEQK